jgi:hypothetical protein
MQFSMRNTLTPVERQIEDEDDDENEDDLVAATPLCDLLWIHCPAGNKRALIAFPWRLLAAGLILPAGHPRSEWRSTR